MIVERDIEESLELLDQEMCSPMDLAYFYQRSPVSDCGSSPSHFTSSSPGSPYSDSDPAGSPNSAYSSSSKAVGRQRTATFQGVRVKNPVRELLKQRRNQCSSVSHETPKPAPVMNPDSYNELKTILNSNKRPHDFASEAPAAKQLCSYPSALFLTPPSTPNPNEGMDEYSKADVGKESSLDLLQSIINIKNESKPVSLNTVQVSWASNDVVQDQCFQDDTMMPNYGSSQPLQAFTVCSPPQNNDQYAYGSLQMQQVPQNPNPEYNTFAGTSPVQNCNSFINVRGAESTVWESNMVQASQLCLPERNNPSPFQVGKSFFQWQIEQEEQKLANVSDQQLLAKDSDGDTCLHISVAQGRRPFSYVVARRMAALNMLDIKEHNNQSAFQVAVAANQHLIAQDLISFGAEVRTTDFWGRTPLHVCAVNGYSKVLEAIHKGLSITNQYLDVDAINYDGLTALHCAVIAHNAVVQQLMNSPQNRASDELLQKSKAMLDTVKTLVMMGASVEAQDRKSGRTALHLAAEEANIELLMFFLESPNSMNFVNAKAFNGNTALHVAASLQYRKTHLRAVWLLMKKGADPSARNLENEQPVHLVPDGSVGEEIRRILKGKSAQHRPSSY
uniref:NFKB inhibitor zeta n=1 Tax=Leptobrachium leishanense TaxID=445787 RepID=A0A8C5LUH6_9ANUR